jgi:uncharacterized membrane protein
MPLQSIRHRSLSISVPLAMLLVGTGAHAASTETFVPTTIHYPGATSTSARGINNRGDIVGTFFCAAACTNPDSGEVSSAGTHGFLLRDGSYMRIDPPVAGRTATTARGVGAQGTIVGHYTARDEQTGLLVQHGFTYQDGVYTFPIDVPAEHFKNPDSPLRHTLPVRISPAGDIVGCIHEANDTMTTMFGWLWRNGEFTILTTPHFPWDTSRDPDTMNNGVAANGKIVGFYFSSGVSYIADETGIVTTFTFEDDHGERFTLAWDVNARGDIVGVVGTNPPHVGDAPANPRGFLRTRDGGYRALQVQDPTGTVFPTTIFGINDRGDIVGQYNVGAVTRGFVHRGRRANR